MGNQENPQSDQVTRYAVRCPIHDLHYNPSLTSGCVLSRREAATVPDKPAREDRKSRLVLLGMLCLLAVGGYLALHWQTGTEDLAEQEAEEGFGWLQFRNRYLQPAADWFRGKPEASAEVAGEGAHEFVARLRECLDEVDRLIDRGRADNEAGDVIEGPDDGNRFRRLAQSRYWSQEWDERVRRAEAILPRGSPPGN
ncbi:MAG: hypothetical protein EHM89_15985, partial [Acidobacteria bacterium]